MIGPFRCWSPFVRHPVRGNPLEVVIGCETILTICSCRKTYHARFASSSAWNYPPLAEKERRLISERTKAGLQQARARGVRLGGFTAGGQHSQKAAAELARRMAPVMKELEGLSAGKAAAELNKRKVPSATGGRWYPATIIRLRARIAATC